MLDEWLERQGRQACPNQVKPTVLHGSDEPDVHKHECGSGEQERPPGLEQRRGPEGATKVGAKLRRRVDGRGRGCGGGGVRGHLFQRGRPEFSKWSCGDEETRWAGLTSPGNFARRGEK